MEKREPDPGGDYGYDLAHDDVRGGGAPGSPTPPQPSTSHAAGTGDRGQDMSYDEAHDF